MKLEHSEEMPGEERLSIVDAARAWWEGEGVRMESHGSGISALWRTEHGPISTVITAIEENRLLNVYVYPAVKVPEPARARVSDLLNRINWLTALWCFELDPAEGTLRVRGSSLVQDTGTAEGIFAPLVNGGLDLMVEHLPTIYAVAFGTAAPADALDAALAAEKNRAVAELN